jgi:hypothetical protein
MTDSDPVQHLLTRYVFIDTEAFRKARFDWTCKTLSKLVEFARQGHLHLLTTEVTKGEVTSQLRELLADAAASVKKHEIVLQQAGAGEPSRPLQAPIEPLPLWTPRSKSF